MFKFYFLDDDIEQNTSFHSNTITLYNDNLSIFLFRFYYINSTHNTFSKKPNILISVASFFRKYSVGYILNYVRLIIIREISYIQLLLQLCTEVRSGHNTTYNENLKLTSNAQLIVFRSLP
jgi:hypothetical protein